MLQVYHNDFVVNDPLDVKVRPAISNRQCHSLVGDKATSLDADRPLWQLHSNLKWPHSDEFV
mgnify:CR=1 FL=1